MRAGIALTKADIDLVNGGRAVNRQVKQRLEEEMEASRVAEATPAPAA